MEKGLRGEVGHDYYSELTADTIPTSPHACLPASPFPFCRYRLVSLGSCRLLLSYSIIYPCDPTNPRLLLPRSPAQSIALLRRKGIGVTHVLDLDVEPAPPCRRCLSRISAFG